MWNWIPELFLNRARPIRRVALALCLSPLLSGSAPAVSLDGYTGPLFVYDQPDETVAAEVLDGPNHYAPSVMARGDTCWLAWLEFVPGRGDRLWVGRRQDWEWSGRWPVGTVEGSLGNPTLTRDALDRIWLTWEAETAEAGWEIFAALLDGDSGEVSHVFNISGGHPGSDFNHRVAASPQGYLGVVWQSDQDGAWKVLHTQLREGEAVATRVVSDLVGNHWHPALAYAPDGAAIIVWDRFNGRDYDVVGRAIRGTDVSSIVDVAATEAFEGYAEICVDNGGRVWLSWEEGARNWGAEYRMGPDHSQSDARGPLHRYRRVRLAEVEPAEGILVRHGDLPMPQFEAARQREDRGPGVQDLGVFYERPKLTADGQGRVWLVYRHYYAPFLGCADVHHVDEGWGLYARCLTEDGWGPLLRFSVGQGDGLQRLSVGSTEEGLVAAWTTGRTDRRSLDRPRGIAVARLNGQGMGPGMGVEQGTLMASSPASPLRRERLKASVDGETFSVFFGDLHRHTDLSLCRVQTDGTLEDGYRYATDPGRLDFLGITDHTRDIARGDALSQLWWRARKEVTRHELGSTFIPLFAYERSRGDTDHNVVTLRPDLLRPFEYPLHEFWQELGADAFTIPHQPFNRKLWNYRDNAHRPLLEIYQGCRDASMEAHALEGWRLGHKFGVIASSDHHSTSASYAGVWAPRADRESLFRSLQARRTFGATAPIALRVHAGGCWMGETLVTSTVPEFEVVAEGTDIIARVEFLLDGTVVDTLEPNAVSVVLRHRPTFEITGTHAVFVRLHQVDGQRAWASPIWLEKPGVTP